MFEGLSFSLITKRINERDISRAHFQISDLICAEGREELGAWIANPAHFLRPGHETLKAFFQ